MTDSHSGNTALRWTSTFFRSLIEHGVEHVIISPGSRSTPLTMAAALNDKLQKHIILDERSAAFTALGIGKATNIPAVLVCTSGTALANYYPAVIEARQSGVPLILATADRPPSLRATGANQAIDQLKIFGDYPVFFHEVGEPENNDKGLDRLQILAKQAFTVSREKRGPVHLNFPFRKPLEADKKFTKKIRKENNGFSYKANPEQNPTSLKLSSDFLNNLEKANKPLIMVGPLAARDDVSGIKELAKKLNCPIISEPSLNTKYSISFFDGFLRNDKIRKTLNPDLIIRFGFQPATKSLELCLNDWNPTHHYHFASTSAWQNATLTDIERIPWYGKPLDISSLENENEGVWLDQWQKTESEFLHFYHQIMQNNEVLTDGSIYHQIKPEIPSDFFVTVSNSFPSRDFHYFGKMDPEIPVFKNRGASGIDGITSSAIGESLAANKGGVLFMGDLAFLHDSNALLNTDLLQNPLVIVVINNSGGSIFRMLPINEHQQYFQKYFETPQSTDFSKIADAHNIPFERISSLSALKQFDLNEWVNGHSKLSILECQTDANRSMEQRKKIWNF